MLAVDSYSAMLLGLFGISLSLSWKVAIGAGLLGATAGLIGSYAVLRRRALLGDVLAHASLPGICLAFLITGMRETSILALGAMVTGVMSVFCVALAVRWTRTREDAAMGVALSSFFGLGVVLLTVIQANSDGSQAGIDSYLFGEIASLRNQDILILGIAAIVAGGACAALHKELKLFCFDEEFARSLGWNTVLLDFAVMSAVVGVVVLGLPVCGVVLIAAMLIYPAAAARYWTNQLSKLVIIATLIGAVAGVSGVLLASPFVAEGTTLGNLIRNPDGGLPPPGPVIVLCGSFLFLMSVLFAPNRGLIAAALRRRILHGRIQREHLLRSLYEIVEHHGPRDREVATSELDTLYRANRWTAWRTLIYAEQAGLIETPGESIRLTSKGVEEASRVTRVHRLWELFLVRRVDIAPDHVDRDADDVEHALPAELIKELEDELAAEGRLPVPPSPHPIET